MSNGDEVRSKRNQKSEGIKGHLITLFDNTNEIRNTDSSEHPTYKNRKHPSDHDVTSRNKENATSIPAKEIILLFQCVRCKDTPLSPPVHICPAGHQSCHQCFTNCSIECAFCHKSFIGRNEILERVIQNMHPITALKLSHITTGNTPPEDDIEHYDPALLAKLERAHYESIRNAQLANGGSALNSRRTQTDPEITSSEPSTVQPSSLTGDTPLGTDTSTSIEVFRIPPLQSYVPVKCPIQSCGGVVTGSAFINHFEFEHLTVPIIAADYNATNCKIAVNPTAFKDYSVQCLAIFLVPNELPVTPSVVKMVNDSEETIMGQIRLRKRSMICLVLAAKFTYIPESSSRSDGDAGETFFLAWTACLYEKSPIYYTIEAVNTTERLHTIKYCGPMGTLHDPQNPNDVFRRGNCLVVSPGLLKRLSNPTGNVDISVSFHPIAV